MRWVPDCYVIYTRYPVEWDKLLELAVASRLGWPVRQGIAILVEHFRLQLPPAFQSRLDALVIEARETEYWNFLYQDFHNRRDLRNYYSRARHEHAIYFHAYSGQSFLSWFARKTLARALLTVDTLAKR